MTEYRKTGKARFLSCREALKAAISLVVLVLFISCSNGNGPDEDAGATDRLVTLSAGKAFTFLSVNAGRGLVSGEYSLAGLNKLIADCNPDVVALQGVDFRTSDIGGRDMVTEIAYQSNVNNRPRQGLFTPIRKANGGEAGLGLLVKGLFTGTERVVLPNGLILHTMNYTLISKRDIVVATCEFDNSDAENMLAQAEALNAYAGALKKDFVLSACIHADADSEVIKTLETKCRRSCRFNLGNTYPASSPANRYTYILTPLSQPDWGTESVDIVGDASVSDHKGILIKIGFIK